MVSQEQSVNQFPAWLQHPLSRLFISLLVSIGSAVLVGVALVSLELQMGNLEELVAVMFGTGISVTLLSYAFYRTGLLQWFGSLRLTMILVSLFTVGLIVLHVWFLSQLMFVDQQYVSLTNTLLIFVGLTAITFGYFVSRAMTDRLKYLSQAANKLAEGDLGTRLPVRGNDEISQLTVSFNMMAQNLQEVDDQKRQLEKMRRDLVAWVSHDLRTPLTSMRVMMEALADGVITDEETTSRYLNNSLSEIEHLSHLIDDLFEMAQLDVGHFDLDFYSTSIRDMISDTISSMMPSASARNITLSGNVDDDVDLVVVAPDKIQRVLYNLVSNAIKYTPANESVIISAKRIDSGVQVDVHNTGVYIDVETLPLLFQSFYRGESSRAQGADGERGTGLGLAIARGFVEAHGGKIFAKSSPETNTTFSFTLPDREETF